MRSLHRGITRCIALCGILVGAYALVVATTPHSAGRDPARIGAQTSTTQPPASRWNLDTARLTDGAFFPLLGLAAVVALYLYSLSRSVRKELESLTSDIGRLSSHARNIEPTDYCHSEIRACADELDRLAQWMTAERGRLTNDASRDALTGLPNRRAMMDCLHRELASAARTGWPLSIIMVDLDHFKKLNDTYGHQAGDFVLKRASERMASLVRETDLVARYGGEEFAIILPRADLAQGMEIAWQLCNALRCDLLMIEEKSIKVSASFGVAELPRGEPPNVEALVRAADLALYQAKEQGRDTVVAAPTVVVVEASEENTDGGSEAASGPENSPARATTARAPVDADTMALMGSTYSVLQVIPDRHRVAHDMLQQVAATIGCASVSLYLLDQETDELRPAASVGAPAYESPDAASGVPCDLLEWFVARRASERVAPEWNAEVVRVDGDDESGLSLRVPLGDQDAWIGVLEAAGVPPAMANAARPQRLLSAVCLIGTTALRICRLFSEQERRWTALTETLCSAMQPGKAYKRDHAVQVSDLAVRIARELGQTDEEELRLLRVAGLVHDIGEASVPQRIREKRGRLRAAEWQQMQQHTRVSADIIRDAFRMNRLEEIVLHHHEHFDGSGYPDGLVGERIPLESRILSVADAFVAMTSERPYRRAVATAQAVERVVRASGAQFDPVVVNAFLQCGLDGEHTRDSVALGTSNALEPAESSV